MKSFKKHIFNATYEWLIENGKRPYIIIDFTNEQVIAPAGYDRDGYLVLNLSPNAIGDFLVNDDGISFKGAFNGKRQAVSLPWDAVVRLYADGTGEGLSDMAADEWRNQMDMWSIQCPRDESTNVKPTENKPKLSIVK